MGDRVAEAAEPADSTLAPPVANYKGAPRDGYTIAAALGAAALPSDGWPSTRRPSASSGRLLDAPSSHLISTCSSSA